MPYDAKLVIVERFVHEALVTFRGDEMPYLVTRDFRCHAWREMGFGDGPAGACRFIGWLGSAFSESTTRIEEIFSSGDRVVVRYVFEAVHSGELFGIPPSGKRISATCIFIARLEGSQIAELWREEDHLGMFRQMGALPVAA